MKFVAPVMFAGLAFLPAAAVADTGDGYVEAEAWLGRDVVPPDVIDNTIDQDRIATELGGLAELGYDTGPVLLRGYTGYEIYPIDGDYNRYTLGIGAQFDVRLDESGRTRLRLQPGYEYVLGNDGRVYDRPRLDAQLIRRHSSEHTTTLRLRYGYRNQTEQDFSGYDQGEWLGELRHAWRPTADSRIAGSLLWVKSDADADRFSYDGWGFMLVGRKAVKEDLEAYGTIYFVTRDYDDVFSNAYPFARSDDQLRVTAGLEHQVSDRFSVFGEGGYAMTNSNVPVREYGGFVGRIGVRYRLDFSGKQKLR